ncbi:O-methyltransferase [Mycolicibacterium palauense]|uniref:O-methyltransferase n=1 Tax=Mycolicibacterium palauense TaxID=2034511 RepID=UPI000BFEC364|nr:class I SAM-dependent methyltransferase [Mycolicibacterium palauense]
MVTSLDRDPVSGALADLYEKAQAQRRNAGPGGPHAGLHRSPDASAQERADAAAEIYMPVRATTGRLLYSLVRATKPATVIEFGMSYGISTLHLAAAVHDNGFGRVVTTEMSATKIAAASRTFSAVGLDDVITIFEGDARETLSAVTGPVGVMLLDGWKEMYLPVLQLVERHLSAGALILADNADSAGAKTYLDYVRDPGNGYISVNIPDKQRDSLELSCRS